MFHGRISPEKGIDVLLKAFAQAAIPDARLVIVGSGNEEYVRELQSLAAANGVAERIEWTGHSNDIHPLIEKADIGICPSHVREAGALSVIEYMAHGKPVIASNNGAQPEYVTSGTNGILVAPGDTQALAEAIATLSDAQRRQAIGKAARETFKERLAYPIFIERIENVYKTVLNNQQP
jgi:glycosyltransferase involved in cell wall biosynthesis